MPDSVQEERRLAELFDVGLIVKIVLSIMEIVGGLLVIFVPHFLIIQIADFVTAGELARDPNDSIAYAILQTANTFAVHAHYVLAIYLLLRGTMKAILAALILRGSQYAYPLFIGALALFLWYETYRAITTSNLLLASVAVFDLALIFLTAHEYRLRYSSSG